MIRQLYHIRQTSTVADYVERFSELVDQLIAYEHSTDPMYYTIRFMDGLRDNIRSIVLVQRPSSLDTAYSLALLQEEVAGPVFTRDSRCPDAGFQWKPPPPRAPYLYRRLLLPIDRTLRLTPNLQLQNLGSQQPTSSLHKRLTAVLAVSATDAPSVGILAISVPRRCNFMSCKN